ncbi:unnamed protein product, partial [Urochloa humidicola]
MKKMKDGDIASLFQKHAAKKNSSTSPFTAVASAWPSIAAASDLTQEQDGSGTPSLAAEIPLPPEEVTMAAAVPPEDEAPAAEVPPEDEAPAAPPPPPPLVYDPDRLPQDPADRRPIVRYPVNDQDAVRRAYIIKGRFRPLNHHFKKRKSGTRYRCFNPRWFYDYHWIEYSVKNDAAFCFVCYLFGKGSGKFTRGGWRNWHREDALDKHVGRVDSKHNAAQERYNLYLNPAAAIDKRMDEVTSEELRLYKIRLRYSLRCLIFLLRQGLAFRGHDESEESNNRGNFLELLKWLAANNEEVDKHVLNNAPGNCTLTCPDIQKQIIQCCAIETRNKIIEELDDDHYAILADESSDVSHKEQLAVCLRYVDKLGRPCEHFLGVVHVRDTTSLSLKEAIQDLLARHHLSVTQIRGQGYDGASNMKGEIKGLKTLIMKESPSAYYIHCFAHQLQLVLVAVAKGNNDCVWFFDQLSLLLNIVGVSCKRHDMIRNVQLHNVLKAIECGELDTGKGLNQEMGLGRPGETRWGSHYKTVVNIICMYPTIRDVLIALGEDTSQRADWPKIHTMVGVFESFDFVFSAHLMVTILGYTNELSECLQRRDQDILNAISLVAVAKDRMQKLRDDGWAVFLQKVTLFCNKHGIQVPAMEDEYVPYGRSRRFAAHQTNDDHFRREVYIGIIDRISQELDTRFDEVNMELLSCMAAFNPTNSFASFDRQKVLRLAEFYPNDIPNNALLKLEMQVDNYIDDLRKDDNFKGLNSLVDL